MIYIYCAMLLLLFPLIFFPFWWRIAFFVPLISRKLFYTFLSMRLFLVLIFLYSLCLIVAACVWRVWARKGKEKGVRDGTSGSEARWRARRVESAGLEEENEVVESVEIVENKGAAMKDEEEVMENEG